MSPHVFIIFMKCNFFPLFIDLLLVELCPPNSCCHTPVVIYESRSIHYFVMQYENDSYFFFYFYLLLIIVRDEK